MTGPSVVQPGLCGICRHVARNDTRRGTVYFRCARAQWDERLVKYPRLPVVACVGFEPVEPPATQAPATQAPTTQAPATQAPTARAPTTQAPTTQPPTARAPDTAPPV